MANLSVSSSHLTSNDISRLASIFETTLRYYCEHHSPFEKDYIQALKTVVGLGFTVTLVDGDLLTLYQPRLDVFLKYSKFKENRGGLSQMARSIAEMTDVATYLFRLKGYPPYYSAFASALNYSVDHAAVRWEKREDIHTLLSLLLPKEESW